MVREGGREGGKGKETLTPHKHKEGGREGGRESRQGRAKRHSHHTNTRREGGRACLLTSSDVPQHFLHIAVFVPELIDARVEGNGAIPDVAGVVDEFVLHFHVGVFEPDGGIA